VLHCTVPASSMSGITTAGDSLNIYGLVSGQGSDLHAVLAGNNFSSEEGSDVDDGHEGGVPTDLLNDDELANASPIDQHLSDDGRHAGSDLTLDLDSLSLDSRDDDWAREGIGTNDTDDDGEWSVAGIDDGEVKSHKCQFMKLKYGKYVLAWGGDVITCKEMWRLLKLHMGKEHKLIWKVDKHQQHRVGREGGLSRFDFFVYEGILDHFLATFSAKFPEFHVKVHVPYDQRQHAKISSNIVGSAEPASAVVVDRSICLKSLNVNSLSSDKRAQIELLCRKDSVDILCLQEHGRTDANWQARISGYKTISSSAAEKLSLGSKEFGEHGVAVMLRNGLPCNELVIHPNYVIVETLVGDSKIIVASIYLPRQYGRRRHVLREFGISFKSALGTCQRAVVLGDFNTRGDKLSALLVESGVHLVPLAMANDPGPGTYFASLKNPLVNPTDIDHILVQDPSVNLFSCSTVDRSWCLSDHYAVSTKLSCSAVLPPAPPSVTRGRLDIRWLRKDASKILGDNRFAALLASLDDELDVENSPSESVKIITEAQAIIKDIVDKHVRPCVKTRIGPMLSKKSRKLIDARSQAFKCVIEADKAKLLHPLDQKLIDDAESARTKHGELLKKVREAIVSERQKRFQTHINGALGLMEQRNYRGFYRWAKNLAEGSRSSKQTTSVRLSDGTLVLDSVGILDRWANFYSDLALDKTGHSRDKDHWQDKYASVDQLSELDGIDVDLMWPELRDTILTMSKNKAAGVSGIPLEFILMACTCEHTHDADPVVPPSNLSKVLLLVIRGLLFSGCAIPPDLNLASVVPVPKKGDPTLCDNYRGISLMECLLKVACTIVNRRLSLALEAAGRLRKEQAGFRRLEEGMAQVISLFEMCQRRFVIDKQASYVCFIDFKKAYDMVPHEAMLLKLRKIGISGQIFDFIVNLYANAVMAVKLPCGVSDLFQLLKGLRQGCPLSPLLFDIFINDILDGMPPLNIPGVPSNKSVSGLLFADDVALVADNLPNLQLCVDHISEWSVLNELPVGHVKCGVMVVHGSPQQRQALITTNISICGTPIPIVERYTYLGIVLDHELDLTVAVEARVASVNNVLAKWRPFLLSRSIPLHMRRRVLLSMIRPVALYGGELFGMVAKRVEPIQKAFNVGIMMTMLGKLSSKSMRRILYRECGVPTIHASMSAACLRAMLKFPNAKTFIGTLCAFGPKKCRSVSGWLAGARRVINGFPVGVLPMGVSDKAKCRSLISHLWLKGDSVAATTGAESWKKRQLGSLSVSSGYVMLNSHDPNVIFGLSEIARMRCGAYWSAMRLSHTIASSTLNYLEWCPCCQAHVPENIEHILCECPAWSSYRTTMFSELRNALPCDNAANIPLRDVLSKLTTRACDIVTLLLGGVVGGLTLSPAWQGGLAALDDITANNIVNATTMMEPLCFSVARFLCSIRKARLHLVYSDVTFKCPSQNGMVAQDPPVQWSTDESEEDAED